VAFTIQHWSSTLADNVVTLYLDGVPQSTGEVPAVAPNRNAVLLGNDAGLARPFTGTLGDLHFHSVALLPEELLGGVPPIP
jgi:hypothetical protein